ncbi:MAG: flagellar basal body rod protein FlgB [Pseudomonadota bacterium]
MTTQNIPLFQAMGAKMQYLNQRQGVIAQNIANADTPNYRPKDLSEIDFGRVLEHVSGIKKVRMDSTNPLHMPANNELPEPDSERQRITYEVAPAENAVILEEQMLKSGQTIMDYNLMTNLYRKNVTMIRTALGRGQGG